MSREVVLREVLPDGTKWGILGDVFPDWGTLEFGQDLRASSSIMFTYPEQGRNSEKLKTGVFVTPFVNGNRVWSDSIFRIEKRSGSSSSLEGMITISGISLLSKLEEMYWMPGVGSNYAEEEMFRYHNVTPGTVIREGVYNWMSRAKSMYKDPVKWLSGVTVAEDSRWNYRVDEIISAGTSVRDIVSRYQEMGIATARFEGFQLITSHYSWRLDDDPKRDKSSSVVLVSGLNLLDREYEESDIDLKTAVLVRGASDPLRDDTEAQVVQWVVSPQNIINKHGYREAVLDVADATTPETLKAVGENWLRQHQDIRLSKTFTIVDNLNDNRTGKPLNTPNVLEDFECGDAITIVDQDGANVYTVYAISVSYDNPSNPNIVLTLNDSFESWIEKFDQRLRRLGG